MLKTRVSTAVVLLLSLLAVVSYGGEIGWNIFVLAVLLGAFWEWARLGKFDSQQCVFYAVLGGSLCTLAFLALDPARSGFPLLALASVFWVAYAPWCLRHVSIGRLTQPRIYGLTGLVLISAAGLALVLAHAQGIVFLLSLIAVCFAADIFAYFSGKAFGKRKLAPRISPGKSWEGAVGGAISVVALSWLVIGLAPQYPVLESSWQVMTLERWHPAVFTIWLLVLSAYSVVGDLFESMLKRRAGVKDSSQLLPGHGGVLDRIDAQLPVLPFAMLLLGASLG